jgi:hypothetical protein
MQAFDQRTTLRGDGSGRQHCEDKPLANGRKLQVRNSRKKRLHACTYDAVDILQLSQEFLGINRMDRTVQSLNDAGAIPLLCPAHCCKVFCCFIDNLTVLGGELRRQHEAHGICRVEQPLENLGGFCINPCVWANTADQFVVVSHLEERCYLDSRI